MSSEQTLCDVILEVWNGQSQDAAKQAAQKFMENFVKRKMRYLTQTDLEIYTMVNGFGSIAELMASLNNGWVEDKFDVHLALEWCPPQPNIADGQKTFAYVHYIQE